ncbi:membrane protein [Streptomyces sp. CNQ-509]|uniref:hypothetical protein n=1 Tax=Streptomyces sp. CNQ-509 TaxID=444103 RepID=UPI00062DEE28|nr:hypothetical protein [Streptomyces sp. CNQ-509]AKH83783.1 membrane protein [Streptomyces sp. CNQ-509]
MSHDDDYVDYASPEPGTRTRFAEGDNDGRYDTRRGGRVSPSRAMVTVVGVVVLLIAAIAFANRGGNTDDDPESTANPDTKAQPTAPTGDTPVKTPVNGIPTGFPHSAEGAQSAAANYTVPLAGAGMFDEDERADIVRALYVPGVAEARLSALDEVYDDPAFLQRIGLEEDGTAPTGTTFVSRINPVGASVKAYTDDTAKIAVWYSALFGLAGEDSENPVTESWYTTTYELQWADGDWKVSDYTQKDGPVPVGRDQTASSAEDMAEAIEEFGGFTYAR